MPAVTVARDGMVTGLACLVLFTLGLHAFLRWLSREARPAGSARRPWRFRWTAAFVSAVMLMFVAGIAAAGIAHQMSWLLASKRPLTTARVALTVDSLFNFHPWIASGVHGYLASVGPQAAGEDLQSWQTHILPHMNICINGRVREELPWDDPRNSAYFKGIVPFYLNPAIKGEIRDPRGYALSHYAGNVHFWNRPRASGDAEEGRGAANIIVAGEVAGGFKPWGDPANLRDPARGIGPTARTFGGPSGTGANLLFLDGSVRFLSNTTDAEVLRKLGRSPETGNSSGGR